MKPKIPKHAVKRYRVWRVNSIHGILHSVVATHIGGFQEGTFPKYAWTPGELNPAVGAGYHSIRDRRRLLALGYGSPIHLGIIWGAVDVWDKPVGSSNIFRELRCRGAQVTLSDYAYPRYLWYTEEQEDLVKQVAKNYGIRAYKLPYKLLPVPQKRR